MMIGVFMIVFIVGGVIATGYYINRLLSVEEGQRYDVYQILTYAFTLLTIDFTLYALRAFGIDLPYIGLVTRILNVVILSQFLQGAIYIRIWSIRKFLIKSHAIDRVHFLDRIERLTDPLFKIIWTLLALGTIFYVRDPIPPGLLRASEEVLSTGFMGANKYLQIVEIILTFFMYLIFPDEIPYRFFKISSLLHLIGLSLEGWMIFAGYPHQWPWDVTWILAIGSIVCILAGLIEHVIWKRKN